MTQDERPYLISPDDEDDVGLPRVLESVMYILGGAFIFFVMYSIFEFVIHF